MEKEIERKETVGCVRRGSQSALHLSAPTLSISFCTQTHIDTHTHRRTQTHAQTHMRRLIDPTCPLSFSSIYLFPRVFMIHICLWHIKVREDLRRANTLADETSITNEELKGQLQCVYQERSAVQAIVTWVPSYTLVEVCNKILFLPVDGVYRHPPKLLPSFIPDRILLYIASYREIGRKRKRNQAYDCLLLVSFPVSPLSLPSSLLAWWARKRGELLLLLLLLSCLRWGDVCE